MSTTRTPPKYSTLYKGTRNMVKTIIDMGLYQQFDKYTYWSGGGIDPLFEKIENRRIVPKTEREQVEYLQDFINRHNNRTRRRREGRRTKRR